MWGRQDLRKLRACSWADRRLLLQAFACLAAMRAAVLLVPFRTITRLLALDQGESPAVLDAGPSQAAARIGWAVGVAAARTPWTSTCLAQGLACMVMLRRQGVGSTLYLAAAKDVDRAGVLAAHAWVRCGEAILTGAAARPKFTAVASFVAELPSSQTRLKTAENLCAPATGPGRSKSERAPRTERTADDKSVELLLECLHQVAARVDRERWSALSREEWQALLTLAKEQQVSGVLYRGLKARALEALVPDEVMAALRDRYRGTAAMNLGFFSDLHSVAAVLKAQGIPVVALKGAHLAGAVYGELGSREMVDIDLLVPVKQLGLVLQALEPLGYTATTPYRIESAAQPCAHHHVPRFRKPGAGSVEIHWSIWAGDSSRHVDVSGLWLRAAPIQVPGGEVLGLSPEDLVLHLCLHTSYLHSFEFGLRPSCDINQAIRHYGARLSWTELVQRAREWRAARGVFLALRLARDLAGADVPDSVLNALCPRPFDEAIVLTARRQIFAGQTTDTLVPGGLVELWGARGARAKARRLVEVLFQPKTVLLEHPAASAGSLRLYRCYAVRLKDVAVKRWRFVLAWLMRDPRAVSGLRRQAHLREWLAGE